MSKVDVSLEAVKAEIEQKLQWGSSAQWTHQDFLELSERILQETGEPLSYVTLKRIWGKVQYESLPNVHTRNILVQFIGYHSWRDFRKELNIRKASEPRPAKQTVRTVLNWKLMRNSIGILVSLLVVVLIILSAKDRPQLHAEDFQFSSKKVVSQGIPNSVVFQIDALQSPYDSVDVQQSWNTALRTRIPKEQKQHTSIYYYPGFFEARLVVGDEAILEHALHITTDGWYGAIQQEPVPVYFYGSDLQQAGALEINAEQFAVHHIPLQPQIPTVRIGNVRDFNGLQTDNFVLEAVLQNQYSEGSGACQYTRVYILCAGSAIWIPLSAPGCIASGSLNFVDQYLSGKEHDLSGFGVDFSRPVALRIVCKGGKASVFVNEHLVYTGDEKIRPVAIKGIDFRFEGPGRVERVRLGRPDGSWVLQDDFSD